MTIAEVYAQYRLMPSLQTHMYRVAGVALEICNNLTSEATAKVHRTEVITACLLHDMGNIIKFDLARFPEFLEPEGLEYWQQVQNEFFAEYGFDEHRATLTIAQELGVSIEVVQLIKAIGFTQTQANYENPDLNAKVCEYADDRVTPFGVVSLEERILDLEERYADQYPGPDQKARRERFAEYVRKIEHQIFEQVTIQPAEITETSVEKHRAFLEQFSI
jgi:hypothetical protein